MLYHFYDATYALLTPLRVTAAMMQTAFQNPAFPPAYTRIGRAIAASAELVERATRRFGKPDFGLNQTSIDGKIVPVQEVVVADLPFCQLVHFRREGEYQQPKVLLVAPMSGHHATLLRGTVEALLPSHEVYITDWLDTKLVPLSAGVFDLDTYIEYLIDFIKLLGERVHIIAVCQPSVPVLAAVSLLAEAQDPQQPASMTLMGGPIDVRVHKTQVNELAEQKPLAWFERTVVTTVPAWYPGAFRRVYPGFLQLSGFMQMNLERHVGEHVKLFQHLVRGDGDSAEGHRRFYDEYLSVMDIPADFYLQTIERVFQTHAFPLGTFTWRGLPVRPTAIKQTALLTVEGSLDDISAPGQTRAAQDLCSALPNNKKKHFLAEGVGHYGIFNGRKWREMICPIVADFIATHDSGKSKATKA